MRSGTHNQYVMTQSIQLLIQKHIKETVIFFNKLCEHAANEPYYVILKVAAN